MTTAQLLNSDLCSLRAWYSERWKPPFLTPKQILIHAVEHGLMAEGDAGEAAEAKAMDLCVDPGLDTAETDLLGVASHISSFANFLGWVVRGQQPAYKRPEPVTLPDGTLWQSGAFLSAPETHLRRVVLLNRWDGWTQSALERSWEVLGETAVYGVGIDLIIIEVGSLRNGRWHNAFTKAFRHPVAKTLRFRKRDGEDFGSNWVAVEREHDSATREEWLDSMTEDGVLADLLYVHSVGVPENRPAILQLAQTKLARLKREKPEENLTACFDRINPCPYRSTCPRGLEPSNATGFVAITSFC